MPPTPDPKGRDARCICGSLLARITPKGIEVKCRRCKRVVMIPFPNEPPGGDEPPPSADRG